MNKIVVSMEFANVHEALKYLAGKTEAPVPAQPEAAEAPVVQEPTPAPTTEAPKAKRGRKPKAEAIPVPEQETPAEPETVPEVPAAPVVVPPVVDKPAVTNADCRAALTKYAMAHGNDKAKALFPAGKVKVSDLTPGECAEVMARIEAEENAMFS